MEHLPVSDILAELTAALGTSRRVLLAAPPGAGKSTWLPLQLLRLPELDGRILLLEPRRLAARNVAQRLAEQLNQQPGETVGYRMRGENCTSEHTRLEVVTEGVLTSMLRQDPMLDGVSLVILDEFHERNLQADLALALLLDIQNGLRDDLKLLIMSATLDNQRLCQHLPETPLIISQGRSFPVRREYLALNTHERFEPAVAREVLRLLNTESGSLLLFLPGVKEIERVQTWLSQHVAADTDLCPLYGALPLTEQRQAILPAPPGRRKVVLATNIAETSLTIEGIRLVVDSAVERIARFDPRSGITRLETQRISQSSMTQRAGRGGRLEPGYCLHLISKEQADRAPDQSEPEILRSDLASLWLELLEWGCHEAEQLCWLDMPPVPASQVAKATLEALGALQDDGQLSAQGRKMARLHSDPRLAALLVCAGEVPGKAEAAARLVAILEEPPRGGSDDLRDHFARPHERWIRRARQLQQRLGKNSGVPDIAYLAELLIEAFPDRLACRRGQQEKYQLASGSGAFLHPHSALISSEWIVAPVLMQGSDKPDARIVLALPVESEQLFRLAAGRLTETTEVEWDEERGGLRAWCRVRIGALLVTSRPQHRPAPADIHAALLMRIRQNGLSSLNWTSEAEQLRARIQCASEWFPEQPWPDMAEAALLASLETWLLPQMDGVQDLKGLDRLELAHGLMTHLTWQQRQWLDQELPRYYVTPAGSRVALHYRAGEPPLLSVRIQEMFGETATPCIAQGRVPLVLELLSPAGRALQITRDLAAFWQGAWRQVQKEMKGRYPKHLWPDDPAQAQPTRRTKQRLSSSEKG